MHYTVNFILIFCYYICNNIYGTYVINRRDMKVVQSLQVLFQSVSPKLPEYVEKYE